MSAVVPILGIGALVGFAWAISTDRRKFPWRIVLWSLGLQTVFALLVLRSSVGAAALSGAADLVDLALRQANAGIELVFGPLADRERFGVILAVTALPSIIYVASVFSVLYHLGVLQRLVAAMAWLMMRTLGTSGAETLAASANVFMGQTEAPLIVAPYLERMTRSELHAVMVAGMATVSGGMLAAFIALGVDARFLLAASLVNAPAALMMAKVIVPETAKPETAARKAKLAGGREVNLIGAAASGASAGMKLVLNVVAMLIAFLGLVALVDLPLGALGLSLSGILGFVFTPVAFLVGAPPAEAAAVGAMLGKKLILNEFVAYLDLAALRAEGALSLRSEVIATFALCGFANLSSVGIQIGGIGAIAPGRKSDLARLGLRALAGGTLATLVSAAIAGMLAAAPTS